MMLNRNAPQDISSTYIFWMLVGIRIDIPKEQTGVVLRTLYLSYDEAAKKALNLQKRHKGKWIVRVVEATVSITSEY